MQTVVEQTQGFGVQTPYPTQPVPDATMQSVSNVAQVTAQVPVETQTTAQPTANQLQIPADAVQLKSGVWVRFKRLNRSIANDLTVKTFSNVNMDKNGNLLTDQLSTKEQLSLAKSISEYNSTLIMNGVELVGTIDDYKSLFDLSDNWLRKLLRSGLVNTEYFDVNDPDDVEFLFLRYYAFNNEDDWALLSQKTLGNE